MSHKFTIQVTIELERESGKFASRDEMAEALVDAIDSSDPGSLDGLGADGESTYTITDWTSEEIQ